MSELIEIGATIMTYVGGLWATIQLIQAARGRISRKSIFRRMGFPTLTGFWLILSIATLVAIVLLSQDLPDRIIVTLSFLAAMALSVLVHVSVMALSGSALGEEIETLCFGFGPDLWRRTTESGAEIRVTLFFFFGGFVKFRALRLGSSAFISAIAPISLILIASFFVGFANASSFAANTIVQMIESLKSFSFQNSTNRIYSFVLTEPFVATLASTFASVAAINALPIPSFNGGHFVIASFQILTGIEVPKGILKFTNALSACFLLGCGALFLFAVIF